ncbi:MAG: hypothetical protein HY331_10695 [Chloroflexi bacterium]|nr:hypothetical protein [Chloroflexota bacterium]
MPPVDPLKWLSPAHWFEGEPGPPSILYVGLAVLLALLLAGSLYAVIVLANRRFASHRLHQRLVRRFGWTVFGLSLTGLLLVAARYLSLPLLSVRFLLYLVLVGLAGVAAFAGYYARFRYGAARSAHEAELLRLRYLPRPKPRPAVPARRHTQKARGKRRK